MPSCPGPCRLCAHLRPGGFALTTLLPLPFPSVERTTPHPVQDALGAVEGRLPRSVSSPCLSGGCCQPVSWPPRPPPSSSSSLSRLVCGLSVRPRDPGPLGGQSGPHDCICSCLLSFSSSFALKTLCKLLHASISVCVYLACVLISLSLFLHPA